MLKKMLLFSMIISETILANNQYFLCGPDEDGCPPTAYNSCVCMPFDGPLASHPYCLDWKHIRCTPLSKTRYCSPNDIVKNQMVCLSYLFQSIPDGCRLITKSFCIKHRIAICKKDGGKETCKHETL